MEKFKFMIKPAYYLVMFITLAWLLFTDHTIADIWTVAAIFFIADLIFHYQDFSYFKITTAGLELKKDIDEARKLLDKINTMKKDSLFLYTKQLQIMGGNYVAINNIYVKILDIVKDSPNISKDDDEILSVKNLVKRSYLLKLSQMEHTLKEELSGKHEWFDVFNDIKDFSDLITPSKFKEMIKIYRGIY